MPMNADILAEEIMTEIGGRKTALRRQVFQKFAAAIIRHIQLYGLVTVITPGAQAGGSALPGTGKVL